MAHILLVDDDAAVSARNALALGADGHDVVTVSTVSTALRAVQQHEPDVVVLEAMLGGTLAGFELARTLASEAPELPLIMLSRVDEHLSRAERAEQDRDGWLPVQRFLEKPVMPEVLVHEVDHLLPVGAAGR